MNELPVRIQGELRPGWLIRLNNAIADAEAAGWHLRDEIRFEGHPYIWNDEPKMASWTVSPDE